MRISYQVLLKDIISDSLFDWNWTFTRLVIVLVNSNSTHSFQVAWLRVDTQTILTIHNHVITKSQRIGVTHSEHRTWYLHIKEVRESDRGWYMCQINTDPMKSQVGYLDVVGESLFTYLLQFNSVPLLHCTKYMNFYTILTNMTFFKKALCLAPYWHIRSESCRLITTLYTWLYKAYASVGKLYRKQPQTISFCV